MLWPGEVEPSKLVGRLAPQAARAEQLVQWAQLEVEEQTLEAAELQPAQTGMQAGLLVLDYLDLWLKLAASQY